MIKERKHMYEVNNRDFIIATLTKKQQANEKLIEKTEAMIYELISVDGSLYSNYLLLKSIKGIGNVNAWMTIAYTENFTSFVNARSYAVYVGVIPFDYSSGTSLRGRKKVSQIANKELKQELNQAAKAAVQWDGEIKAYAERKLKTNHYVCHCLLVCLGCRKIATNDYGLAYSRFSNLPNLIPNLALGMRRLEASKVFLTSFAF